MKPVLFVDVDGTVLDSTSWWLALYNQEHGTQFDKNQVLDYDYTKYIPNGLSKYYRDYDHVQPVEGAVSALHMLRPHYRIVFATAGFCEPEVLRKWFRVEDKDFIRIRDKSLLRGWGLVDDYPLNLDTFIGQRFLLGQPWNANRGLNDAPWWLITEYLVSISNSRR